MESYVVFDGRNLGEQAVRALVAGAGFLLGAKRTIEYFRGIVGSSPYWGVQR